MIGIVPIGGKALRMQGLPKCLLPTLDGILLDVLLEKLRKAGAREIIAGTSYTLYQLLMSDIQIDKQKLSIQIVDTDTMNETILKAKSFIKWGGEWCALGMPDTYFDEPDPFTKIVDALSSYSVAVGVFRAREGQHSKLGMVDIQDDKIVKVIDKPKDTELKYGWGCLGWNPIFWNFIKEEDDHIGFAIQRAIDSGIIVKPIYMSGGYYDCGSPEGYFELIRR